MSMDTCNVPLPATTPLRAIDIHGTNEHQATQEWFFTHERMLQYLAIRQMYVDTNGVIKDSVGEITGMWYFAEFSAKYPEAEATVEKVDSYPAESFMDDYHQSFGTRLSCFKK